MFRLTRLRTKLTVLYAGLFGLILLLIAASVYTAVTGTAERTVRRELGANGAVFDRVWAMRTAQLHDEADVLAHDFGFRAAVATGDEATVRSALENLRARLRIDSAFVVGLDGKVEAAGAADTALPPGVVAAVEDGEQTAGVFMIGNVAYQAATAPILAPAQVGAVVFAKRIDRAEMASLEKLAAIPLHASVISRPTSGAWRAAGSDAAIDARAVAGLAAKTQTISGKSMAGLLQTRDGPAAAVLRPLETLSSDSQVALLLTYPMAEALSPVRALLFVMVAIGAAGLLLLIGGSWVLAGSLTRPLLALEDAAQRLRRGEYAQVAVSSQDEIGHLAANFNAMARDIRDREERLERAKNLAEVADRAKSAFLANMSHELRTPLNGVLGVVDVLAATGLDPKQRGMVRIIESSAAVLQRVLCDVLDLARIEVGRVDFLSEPFALDEAVRFVAASAEVQAQAKGLDFNLNLAADVEAWVTGDRVRLEQILGNLLNNAVKFTATGRITLRIDRIGEAVRFAVRDTGVGFDPAVLEQLFQPFQQGDNSITRRFGGTGLGLSIARDLARGMGGDVTGSGQPDAGAAFTLTLPLAPCAPGKTNPEIAARVPASAVAPPAPLPDQDAAEADPAALRILLAEDHPANREVVRLILESVGVHLEAVEDGALAVEAFKREPFDAVLMDIQMPVMDGLTAIRLIREHELKTGVRHTPILVLSANVMPEFLEGSAAAGADDHLAKPVVAPVLLEALDRALTAAEASAEAGVKAG